MALEDFIPTISALAPELTLRQMRPPDRSELFACIGVAGLGVSRRSWTNEVELSEKRLDELRAEVVPKGDPGATGPRGFRRLRTAAPRFGRCTDCWLKPGLELCSVCGGRAQIFVSDAARPCGCTSGYRTCDSCDGTARAARVVVEYFEDRAQPFAHVFFPDAGAAAITAMQTFVRRRLSVPAALRIRLDDDFASGDGYRGGNRGALVAGARLGSALEHARHYVERLRSLPSIAAIEFEAHAWPFSVLSWNAGAVAYAACDENGQATLLV